jgi:hypothetical protein
MRNKKIIYLESGDQKIAVGAGQADTPCLNQRLWLAQIFNPVQACARPPQGGRGRIPFWPVAEESTQIKRRVSSLMQKTNQKQTDANQK